MKRLIQTSAFTVLGFAGAVAQGDQTVTGSVLDPAGDPVIGATVLIQGSAEGTITDSLGVYELTVPEQADTLEFKYVGYAPVRLPVDVDSERVDAMFKPE